MDVTVYIILGHCFDDSFCALNVNILQSEVPRYVISLYTRMVAAKRAMRTLLGSLGLQGCIPHLSALRSPQSKVCFGDRIPAKNEYDDTNGADLWSM